VIRATEILHPQCANELADLSETFHAECDPGLTFERDEIIRECALTLVDLKRDRRNAWVVRDEGFPVGFAVGEMFKYLFSSELFSSLIHWYVIPSYRKTRAPFELLHNYENWSKINGATRSIVGAGHVGSTLRNVNDMFRRRGLKTYGELFYKDINQCQEGMEVYSAVQAAVKPDTQLARSQITPMPS
jgi:hypothetical protein